ncbi:response regulator transcription factor (plasmid) [Clostridium botulinum]|uniref:Stage 0 sporulation protein A homolog n=1 Tax=Clostridium botulinum C/D str. DC5 TaxID=1443128 RepID=A0A0A0HY76_CLOBO|nr:LytTR family DNA-binding domain-containing protein [Clostridium botulinum]KEH99945.1 LytTR family transcriptional regulator [Clostridium botulinum C/D str. BKT75002]KEI05668.1 LytTR family transcriptional regulator [Clostridium botulinum C/D str. BKT2873]KGM93021.1 LytTR family transcriptional regulator [Clostridium botulinum C/D str. DC5]KOC51935.1 LytTR family transcriptional regulator [Clostridium botulinum]KOC56618.1 LytTR family transcriptional regulator [Clostridium botulinum]
MYSILLAEDNLLQRQNLKTMIEYLDIPINIYESSNDIEAYTLANRIHIDIFLIDIELYKSSGLDLAIKLRSIEKYEFTWIIFLTTHSEFLTEAFTKVHCYDFILKPYNKDKVLNMIKRIIKHDIKEDDFELEKKTVTFEMKNGIYIKIYVHEIIFIEISMRKCVIHTFNGKFELKGMSLKKILEIIDENTIAQSHKSFAINLNYIEKIIKIDSRLFEVVFENYNDRALVGNKFKESILEKFECNNL